MAAVLACGPGALLSHTSAAELWGLIRLRGPAAMVEISVPAGRHPRPRRVRTHRRKGLRKEDATIRDAIPLTSPARTLADLASRFAEDPLEAAINAADKRGVIDPERLRRELDGMSSRGPGVARLRTLLDARTFTLTDSHLERLFLPLARRAGLPEPLTQRHENVTGSTSSGRTPVWSSRPTASPTTGRRRSRPLTGSAIRTTRQPA